MNDPKLSRDKQFLEKLTDVVGLYLHPPDKAIVLCVDEKSQIQALDRTQPGLPLKKGRCGTMTHDYKRHGTTTLSIDWSSEDLERVTRTVIKRHNAEIHAQTAIDTALELKRQHQFSAAEVDRIDVETFDVAYKIIGGGEEGDKSIVCTKEDADHSLPYLIAVAILDNEVLPAQFVPDRLQRADVQQLLCRVVVRPTPEYSQRFPDEMPAGVAVTLKDGRTLSREVREYPGLNGPPLTWKQVLRKFEQLSSGRAEVEQCRNLAEAVRNLESIAVSDLTALLVTVGSADASTTRDVASRTKHDGRQ